MSPADDTERALTEEELERFCDYLYRRTGMTYGESKRYYIDRRVAERMKATGEADFRAYFGRLRSEVGELEQIINAFTVNETYFYREAYQFACMSRVLLPQLVRQREAGSRVRILSEIPAPRARNRIRSPSGCSRTGRWSTPTTSRSSARTSTPRLWRRRGRVGMTRGRCRDCLRNSSKLISSQPAALAAASSGSLGVGELHGCEPDRIGRHARARSFRSDLLPQRTHLFR